MMVYLFSFYCARHFARCSQWHFDRRFHDYIPSDIWSWSQMCL